MSEIVECTAENPWNREKAPDARVRHHDTEEVGDQRDGWPGGDMVSVRCKNCGHQWEAELPQ